MIQSYKVAGMTCNGCVQIVQDSLSKIAGVIAVNVNLAEESATVETDRPLPVATLQEALANTVYEITETDRKLTGRQPVTGLDEQSEKHQQLVADYITAAGHLDYTRLQEYLHPDFYFNGAMQIHSAAAYIKMIREHAASPVSGVLAGNNIKAIFAGGDDCCVIYEVVSSFPGKTVPFAEWIKIEEGKIRSTEVKFNLHSMKQLMEAMNKAKKAG